MISADEYYLYGSGGGSYGGYTGFAVDAFAPQSRDLYNYTTSFYTAEKFGGGLGPAGSDFEETIYACPDGTVSFGSPCPQTTAQGPTATTTTPAQTPPPAATTAPPALSSGQLPAVVVPLLIGLLVFAVLK